MKVYGSGRAHAGISLLHALGCGNGWVVRKVAKNPLCIRAVGIDGAEKIISNGAATK